MAWDAEKFKALDCEGIAMNCLHVWCFPDLFGEHNIANKLTSIQ